MPPPMRILPAPDERGNYYLGRNHRDLPQILKGGKGKTYNDQGRLACDLPDIDRWFIITDDGPVWDSEDCTKLRYFDSPHKALRYLK